MNKTYNYGDFKVRLSNCEKYVEFDSGRFAPVRYKGNDRYFINVITTDKGCPRGTERIFLDRVK